MPHAARVPPTLMLRPDGLAPARHHRFANVPPGVPFATSRANSRLATLECHRCISRDHNVQRYWRAMPAEKQTRRCAARVGKRASGRLSLRCRACRLHRIETVRTHFALQDLIDTLPPSSAQGSWTHPRALRHASLALRFCGMESRKRLRAGATVPGEIVPR